MPMPKRTLPCRECGQPAEEDFGEGLMGWYASRRCPSCGNVEEEDGFDAPLPAELRTQILAEEGEWVLEATAEPSVAALKVIRERRSLPMSELRTLARGLPGEVARGTRHEVTKLRDAVLRQDPNAALLVRRRDEA